MNRIYPPFSKSDKELTAELKAVIDDENGDTLQDMEEKLENV